MSPKRLRAHSLALLVYALVSQPTKVLCQGQFFQDFMVPETWRNYCPDPVNAIGSVSAESRSRCAAECNLALQCVDFSYYATSRLCYFYSCVPQKISYNNDCIFMMDRDALSGCPTKASVQGSFFCTNDKFDGCRTLTKVDGTLTVCLAPPGLSVQMEAVDVDLGNGSIPLPSVNNWIVMMQRFDGSLGFYQNWASYRDGFGSWESQGEFWLGNEIVHLLTNRTGIVYRLRIEVQLYTRNYWLHADYDTFSLDSESNNYAIRIGRFSGSAGDSLTNTSYNPSSWYHGGMNFSTWDADNDRTPRNNCAFQYQSGWWFNNCWMSCLTCTYGNNFAWESLLYLEPLGRLRAARMMIRSV